MSALQVSIVMWLCSLQAIVMIVYTLIKAKKPLFDIRILLDLAIIGLLIKMLDVYLTYSDELITMNLKGFIDGRRITTFSMNMAYDTYNDKKIRWDYLLSA